MNRRRNIIFLILLLFNTSCGLKTVRDITPTPTRIFVTATLLPTFTPIPSETPVPNPPTPTVIPVEGIATTQINVRAQPSTSGNVLGIIAANATVQIVGKDPAGNWWQILYPASPDGLGWVTAQYVTVTGVPDVPVIGGSGSNQNSGNVAIIQQQLNVRSGPGTDFNSLGTLNPQDVVNLVGKEANGAWLQIEFPAGPDGKGWINAAFVQATGVENLPIITEAGQVVGTETPTGIPPTPTATILPALLDNDSASQPIKTVLFDRVGTHTLIYNGDVSSPDGDMEDWIAFTPFSHQVSLEITCKGSQPRFELIQNGRASEQAVNIGCGTQHILPVEPDQTVQVHVSAVLEGSQNYSSYTLKVSSIP